jgi:ribosomal protein L29
LSYRNIPVPNYGVLIKIKEIRVLNQDALKAQLQDLELQLSVERRKIASTGVSSKVVKVRDLKRTRARILTIMKEKGVTR